MCKLKDEPLSRKKKVVVAIEKKIIIQQLLKS